MDDKDLNVSANNDREISALREQLESQLLSEIQDARKAFEAGQCGETAYRDSVGRLCDLIFMGKIPNDRKQDFVSIESFSPAPSR